MSVGQTTAFEKIASLTKPLRVVCGGTSAGKTYAILQYLIYYALKRELLISVVAESYPVLSRGAYQGQGGFIEIIKKMGLYEEKNHNKTSSTYQLNKSTFEFFPADDASKLRGSRRDILFLNESNNISFAAYQELSDRCNLFTIMDFNPTAEFFVHTELLGKVDCDFITVTFKDNEFLNDKIKATIESWEELGKTSEFYRNRWLVMGLGQLGMQSGAIYTDWHLIDELPTDAQLLGSALDFGFSNDPAALASIYRYDGKIIIDEVVYQTGLLNKDLAEKIRNSDAKNGIIYADSAEPKSIADLRTYGLQILPVFKGKDSISYGIQLVQSQPIYITARSKNVIKELQGYVWATDKNGNQLTIPKGADHILDAVRYFFLMKMNKQNTNFSLKWKR